MFHLSTERLHRIVFLWLLYWPERVLPYYYYPTIFWSPNNCRFNLNKPATNEFFHFKIRANSHLFFVCPNHAIWSDMGNKSPHYGRMYENLLLVDEQGFKDCSMGKKGNQKLNREIFRCDQNPQKFTYTEEIFSSQRAFSHKMKYEPGKNYSFISTSDGTIESLNNTADGHCKTHQMKLKVYVCPKDDPCEFEMPKCPFSDVFDHMHKRVPKPRSTASVPTSPRNEPNVSMLVLSTKITKQDRSHDQEQVSNTEKRTPAPVETDKLETAKQSSSMSIWGKERTHIIVHITMSLFIVVLILCLVYVFITRSPRNISRRNKDIFLKNTKAKNKGVDSKLFQHIHVSLEPDEEESPVPSLVQECNKNGKRGFAI